MRGYSLSKVKTVSRQLDSGPQAELRLAATSEMLPSHPPARHEEVVQELCASGPVSLSALDTLLRSSAMPLRRSFTCYGHSKIGSEMNTFYLFLTDS